MQAREAGLAIALVATALALTLASPFFLTVGNMLTVGKNASEIGILALGMTIVLVTANVDLSVGAIYAAGGITASIVLVATGSPFLAIAAAIFVGAGIGSVNGALTGFLGLNSFMVTLATLNIVRGLALWATGGGTVTLSGHDLSEGQLAPIEFLADRVVGGINMEFIFFLTLVVVLGWMLRTTRLGFNLYAVGGNPYAARNVGISVPLIVLAAFAISGALAAFTGVLALSFVGTMNPLTGAGLEFDVFAASVIGGSSLSGGRGSMVGTMLGALFLSVARNGFILLGISAFAQTIAIGAIIIIAIGIDRWFTLRQAR
ncbi:MAG: ABC transporter permease [Chloroflexota bacterium]|nr:ABC transporter permease [Chloroflexota bacterium]